MNKKMRKLILIVISCVILSILVLLGIQGVKLSLSKARSVYNNIISKVDTINNALQSIQSEQMAIHSNIQSEEIVIHDSLTDKILNLSIGKNTINIDCSHDNVVYEVDSLYAGQPIDIKINNIEGIEVRINNQEINPQSTNKIVIDKISIHDTIEISIHNIENNDSRNFYIKTLPSDFPKYNYVGGSQYEGDYYLTLKPKPFYMVKLNNKGEVVYYQRDAENPFFDFKQHNLNGKIRYSYQEADRRNSAVSLAYELGDIVILDESYNEIDRIRFKEYGSVVHDFPVENHDFMLIDDGHYIVSTYLNKIVDNIPEDIPSLGPSTKVLATILQEVKNGEVIWQWESTDYPELYGMSVEGNTYAIMGPQWNDYVHFNSMTIDPKDNNLVCSFRNIDALLKLDRKTGNIIWVLGGKSDEFGLSEYQKFSRQHHATFIDDNTILLFDNGNKNELTRILEMTIDEENKKLVQFKELSVGGRFSATMGSVQKIDNEKDVYLIGWGRAQSDTAIMTEYDAQNNKVLSELHFVDDNIMAYRVYKSKY